MMPSRSPLSWPMQPVVGDMPVGAVIAFAGAITSPVPDPANSHRTMIEPFGWMPCDGRTLRTGDYPELFATLGYLYGGSDGQFLLPDYRGCFLRGANGDGGRDADTDTRLAAAQGEQAGVGSTQTIVTQTIVTQTTDGGAATTHGQGNAPSLRETRPVNVAVNYIIRYTAGLNRLSA